MSAPKVIWQGQEHGISIPRSFAIREELCAEFTKANEGEPNGYTVRMSVALLGLCTRVGRHHGLGIEEYEDHYAGRPARYGGALYSRLRAAGLATSEEAFRELGAAARAIQQELVAQLYPREREVQQAVNFTAPAEEPST